MTTAHDSCGTLTGLWRDRIGVIETCAFFDNLYRFGVNRE